MEQVMWDTVGLVISKASQYAVEVAALLAACGTIWRLWIRPARDRIYRTMIAVEAMADLVTTEFKTNGGSSIKDAAARSSTCRNSLSGFPLPQIVTVVLFMETAS